MNFTVKFQASPLAPVVTLTISTDGRGQLLSIKNAAGQPYHITALPRWVRDEILAGVRAEVA